MDLTELMQFLTNQLKEKEYDQTMENTLKDREFTSHDNNTHIKKRSSFYRHGFFLLLCFSLLCCGMIFFLLLRDGYFASLQMAISQEDYDYMKNASYIQRKTQFEMLPPKDADIVFAGDSITARFEWDEYFTDYTIANRGIDSDVSAGLLNRLDTIISQNPEQIFLMVGINDIQQDIPLDTTLKNYSLILDRLQEAIPDCRIYVQSVLPVNSSTGIDNSRVQDLNTGLSALAADRKLTYIDIYSHMADDQNDFPYTVDGVHPTGEGYQIWMDILKEYID